MREISLKKRAHGWMMFDWATQPYPSLIITFFLGPYFAEQVISQLTTSGLDPNDAKVQAQSLWGLTITISGLFIAFFAPILGAIADGTGRRLRWVWFFSLFYIIGSASLWFASPIDFPTYPMIGIFIIGIIGVEFMTIFTNAMLPSFGNRAEIGLVSGKGSALGYFSGFLSVVAALLFFAEDSHGLTLIGSPPIFGLDPSLREGTRFIGPFVAIWFVISMIPFALWVREPKSKNVLNGPSFRAGLSQLWSSIKSLPSRKSFSAYLLSTMFARDALNGVYAFGGIYAISVLNWSVVQVGTFGILGTLSAALFTYVAGRKDAKYGPKPVIQFSIVSLALVCVLIMTVSPESVLFFPVAPDSSLPDVAFYISGLILGAAGGALLTSGRTMIVVQADPERVTEAFGLFAVAGKATSFLAPAMISIVTIVTGSQQMGIIPLIVLFLLSLILLTWVKPDGDEVK